MSILELLQSDIAGRLQADPYFDDVAVFVVRPRGQEGFAEIQTKVDQALLGVARKGGKTGAAVQVLMPGVDVDAPNAPGPMMQLPTLVRVQELVIPNMGPGGTQKSAEEIALKVLQLLHHFNPGRGAVLTAAPDALRPTDAFAPKVTVDLLLTTAGGISPASKAARPAVSAAGLTVTLSCATPGAQLYYTTDAEVYPSSRVAAATRYTAPFTLAAAATVRVAAEAAGYTQSDVVSLAVA